MRSDIFRKVALDRLSSPEQLDQLMQVTTPFGWAALGAVGGLLAAAVAWSAVGTLPERVSAQGILVRSGGVYEVVSSATGRMTDVSVRVGDVVTEGQVIARVGQEDLVDQVQQARARVASLEHEQREATTFGARDAALQIAFNAQQGTSIDQSVAAAQQSLAALQERLAAQAQLGEQGLVTRQAVLAIRQQVDGTQERIRQLRADQTQLALKALQLRNARAASLQAGQTRLEDARRELARVEHELQRASEVVSPYTGRVLEVMTEQGSVVNRGEPVLSVDLTGKSVKDLEAVLYVSSVHGKKLKPGMEIEIAPSTVRKEEFGYMLGKVTYVSDFPATQKGMNRVLKNEQLVSALSGRDAPYEVHADLVPDAETPSTYRWSSSSGPPLKVQSGTLAAAEITVARRRPIAMVLPLMRKYAGS